MQASKNGFTAVGLVARPTAITRMADINNWFEASSLSNSQVLHPLANLHNHTCTFMAGALSSKFGHLWDCPVIKHEMNVTHAETGCIELDQHIFRARNRYVDIPDFL
jgi:hypothetical protein